MRQDLQQRYAFLRRSYTFVTDGIRVSEVAPASRRTVTVPYEVLLADREEIMTASKGAMWSTIVMTVLTLFTAFAPGAEAEAWWFWGVLAAMTGTYFWASRRDQIGFSDDSAAIYFLRDRPSAEALEEFLEEGRRRARERIRDRILPLQQSDDAQFDRKRAQVLRDKGILTDDEYDEFTRGLGPTTWSPRDTGRLQN